MSASICDLIAWLKYKFLRWAAFILKSTSKPLHKCCVQKKKIWRQELIRNCQASPGSKWLAGEKPAEAYTRLRCRCVLNNKIPEFDGTFFFFLISSRVCRVLNYQLLKYLLLYATNLFFAICTDLFEGPTGCRIEE